MNPRMSKAEIHKLVGLIGRCFSPPNGMPAPKLPDLDVEAWLEVLERRSFEACRQAVIAMAQEGRDFAPSPSQLHPVAKVIDDRLSAEREQSEAKLRIGRDAVPAADVSAVFARIAARMTPRPAAKPNRIDDNETRRALLAESRHRQQEAAMAELAAQEALESSNAVEPIPSQGLGGLNGLEGEKAEAVRYA